MNRYLTYIAAGIAGFLILGLAWSVVRADSEGPNPAGTGANDASVGTVAWASATSISASDEFAATASSNSGTISSQYLKGTNFGFSIPSDATIDGIEVFVERRETRVADNVVDQNVRIVKADGSFGTENKADTLTEWPTTDTVKTYGSSSDLWSETWTPADINDADFGVALSASVTFADPFTGVARVDQITMTVHYTVSGPTPELSRPMVVTGGTVRNSGTIRATI